VTKPGNSDPKQSEQAEETTASTPDSPATEATEATPAAEPAGAEEPAEAEPADKAKPDKAVISEPLMAELEKAPPAPEEPVMPTAREAAASLQARRRFEEPPPRMLKFSFYFFLAAGLVWLISMIVTLVLKDQIIVGEVDRNKNPDLTPDQIASGVSQILWVVTIAAVTFAVFLGLFGYKATEGTRRARTLVTIVATVMILFHLLLNGTVFGILSAFLALLGLALLWSPTARTYFPPRDRR
jgi:hypothetical protein